MREGILICDRDQESQETCRRFFADHDFDVRTAESGVDCLALLRRFQPGLLILDVGVLWGGADGVLECIRRDGEMLDSQMVIVTGKERPHALSSRTGVPQRQCLQKPIRPSALVESLFCAAEGLINNGRRMSKSIRTSVQKTGNKAESEKAYQKNLRERGKSHGVFASAASSTVD